MNYITLSTHSKTPILKLPKFFNKSRNYYNDESEQNFLLPQTSMFDIGKADLSLVLEEMQQDSDIHKNRNRKYYS